MPYLVETSAKKNETCRYVTHPRSFSKQTLEGSACVIVIRDRGVLIFVAMLIIPDFTLYISFRSVNRIRLTYVKRTVLDGHVLQALVSQSVTHSVSPSVSQSVRQSVSQLVKKTGLWLKRTNAAFPFGINDSLNAFTLSLCRVSCSVNVAVIVHQSYRTLNASIATLLPGI